MFLISLLVLPPEVQQQAPQPRVLIHANLRNTIFSQKIHQNFHLQQIKKILLFILEYVHCSRKQWENMVRFYSISRGIS